MARIKFFTKDADIEVFDDKGEPEKFFLSSSEQEKILRQIEKEYQLCYSFNESKRQVMLKRLKLYNNQKRDDKAVGDPLMFTVFNTILAALYEDKLSAKWEGRGGEGDEDIENNLNALSEYDYDLMEKDKLDYFWDWDTLFFGRGLVLLMDFERKKPYQCPIPEYLPAITFIRDPRATSVNGDMRGRGAMRFGGREVGLSYWEMKKIPAFFNLSLLKKGKEVKSLLDDLHEAHRDAQGLENFHNKEEELNKHENYEFTLLEWFTHYKGEKYLFTLGNSRKLLVRYQKIGSEKWPIADRTIYPMSSSWDGVTIPDLTEDKQRARAVLINLGLSSAKADVLANYLYDSKKITNRNDINFKKNKFIPVNGDVNGAMQPIQKSTAHQFVTVIMDTLDVAAQRATATPEIQQGIISSKQRTLGELEMVSSGVDTRYGMSAKIFGWSEKAFWRFYYWGYKKYFKEDIDEKLIRIQGALAPTWRPLTRDNIIAEVDPDVKIESKVLSEAKRLRDQRNYGAFASVALQDPTANRRFILKKLGKLYGATPEEITIMFPKTADELQAEDENALLDNDKLAPANMMDDHLAHLEIHAKANQTPAAIAHIRMHKKMLVFKKSHPELFPRPEQTQFQIPGALSAEEKPTPPPANTPPQT